MKSAFEVKMQRQHELSEVRLRVRDGGPGPNPPGPMCAELCPSPPELQPECPAGPTQGGGPPGGGGV